MDPSFCLDPASVRSLDRVDEIDGAALKTDYPMAKTILLYVGKERLRMGDVQCMPCKDLLRTLRPGMDWENVDSL